MGWRKTTLGQRAKVTVRLSLGVALRGVAENYWLRPDVQKRSACRGAEFFVQAGARDAVITVSLETMKIVRRLPRLFADGE